MIKRPHFLAELRPNRRPRSVWRECPTERRELVAKRVFYEGSPYHRRSGTGATTAKRRYKAASKCDAKWTLDAATEALRRAVRKGFVTAENDWRGDLPRYIWYRDLEDDVVYEAFLHNEVSGAYHAYPIHREQWPVGMK